MTEKATHLDPTHTAVAAILALDFDGDSCAHTTIADALRPLVAAAPTLREWDVDDEWTAVEEAVAAAACIVDYVENPKGTDPWLRCQVQVDRLRKMQRGHVCGLIRERIGTFNLFNVSVSYRWGISPRVRIFPAGVSSDLEAPIFEFDPDATRREVEIAIAAWKAGNDQGLREGAERIRRGMRELLEVEAA